MSPYQAFNLHPDLLQTNVIPWVSQHDPRRLLVAGFHELHGAAPGDETLALAFALSLAARASGNAPKSLCLCSVGSEAQERGELYGHGLAALGIEPERMLMVAGSPSTNAREIL